MRTEANVFIFLICGSLLLWLIINEYQRLMPILKELKQSKKRYMNIDDIRSEKIKLQIAVKAAIESFTRNTGCNVIIRGDIVKDDSKSPYGDKSIFHDKNWSKTKIRIDVLIN